MTDLQFRFYGEQMVKACVQAKTHYMDVSGEPEVCKVSSFKFSLVILVTSRAEVSNSIYLGSSAFKFWVGLSRIMFSVRKALMKHSYVLKYLFIFTLRHWPKIIVPQVASLRPLIPGFILVTCVPGFLFGILRHNKKLNSLKNEAGFQIFA